VRGIDAPSLTWTDAVLDELARSALLGYLAVAHYGRGRGDWAASEHPDFWQDSVADVMAASGEALHALWEHRGAGDDAPALATELRPWFEEASGTLLRRLYPEADGLA
jgi:hypothetical protein